LGPFRIRRFGQVSTRQNSDQSSQKSKQWVTRWLCLRRPVDGPPLSSRSERSGSVIYHHLSGESRPAACSSTCPRENRLSSSNGRPINCSPSGSPLPSSPAGTEMPGRPAMFAVTVNTSFKYISTGSPEDFSPSANAPDGVVGVSIAWIPESKLDSE